jgi:hypothetical protein
VSPTAASSAAGLPLGAKIFINVASSPAVPPPPHPAWTGAVARDTLHIATQAARTGAGGAAAAEAAARDPALCVPLAASAPRRVTDARGAPATAVDVVAAPTVVAAALEEGGR